ncbi:MAG: hypothetical protein KKA60_03685 [Proteobacteria bacterium]|nr:hypothetical protein [Pseudomonadota bacterium]
MKIRVLFLFLSAFLVLGLQPALAEAKTSGDILQKIKEMPGVFVKGTGQLDNVSEDKKEALYLMFRFETASSDRRADAEGNPGYGNLKALLLRELWTTALIITTDGIANPVLGLQSALHYPDHKRAPVRDLDRQDFFLWCLEQVNSQGLLRPDDARGYLKLTDHHPRQEPGGEVNPEIPAFLESIAGQP